MNNASAVKIGMMHTSTLLPSLPRALKPIKKLEQTALNTSSAQATTGIWWRQLDMVFCCATYNSLLAFSTVTMTGLGLSFASLLICPHI